MQTVILLNQQEKEDIIAALVSAQAELCCGEGFPEANAQWERWEQLICRFKCGATAD